jgi:outer membrane protein assembly factor BamA
LRPSATISGLLLWTLSFTLPVQGQIDSRAAEIEALRAQKASHLKPDELSRAEQTFLKIKEEKIIERITAGIAGFRVKFGGLVTQSGFALGPEYLRQDLANGNVIFRGSAVGSLNKYIKVDLQLTLPKLANDRLFLDFYAAHRNFPQMQYYGPGPDSDKGARSNYRLEGPSFDVTGGVKPLRHLKLGGTFGYLRPNVGRGTNRKLAFAEDAFTPGAAPGIDRQPDFLRGGVFAQYDYRDIPGGPRKGGYYAVKYYNYSDRNFASYSFRRLSMEAQQYVPFFNERRVIALRGKSELSYTGSGQAVPFYLQPTVGGSDDLRGFRSFRFHDDNTLIMNAEYRWETFSGLDMALFVDGGKIFPRRSDFNLKNLEASCGFGMRFNVQNSVFLRLDVGFSHEGFQVWVKFSDVFQEVGW